MEGIKKIIEKKNVWEMKREKIEELRERNGLNEVVGN